MNLATKNEENLTFRRYCDNDFEAYTELYQTVYGKLMDVEFFIWKHRQNLEPPEELLIFLVLNAEGKIIGANSFFPEKLAFNEQTINSVQSGDTMVHPDYRGRGIFMKILKYAVNELKKLGYSCIYGFANGNSYPGFLKYGFDDLGRINVYYKILSWAQFLRSKGQVGYFLGTLLDYGNAGIRFLSDRQVDKLYSVSRMKLTDDLIHDFLEKENRAKIHPQKTVAYLQWKYEKKPKGSYQTWAIYKKGECVAVFVLRVERQGEGLAGEIVEYAAYPGEAAQALKILLKRLHEGFEFIRVWESNDVDLMAGMHKNRFICRKAELYFIYYALQEAGEGMAQRKYWEVIGGNADTV